MTHNGGLEASMWASTSSFYRLRTHIDRHEPRSQSLPPPSPPAAAVAANRDSADSLARVKAFHRFEQTCQRLRWKFIDLENSYNRALGPSEWGFTTHDAEINFKVDFYEFYAWIEQGIVFVLLVYGVRIQKTTNTQRRAEGRSSHAYHHDVLKALEEPGNPLHETLGTGDVNQALWKAKELRNRWKDAAEGRDTPPLKMYDLRWIVTQVLGGLEVAYHAAGREVEMHVVRGQNAGEGVAPEEEGWEWMVESMDWEA